MDFKLCLEDWLIKAGKHHSGIIWLEVCGIVIAGKKKKNQKIEV